MKKILIAALLILLPSLAYADETDHYLFAPIGSYHMDRDAGYCETNPGLAYQKFRTDNQFYTVGVFKNSPCKVSVFAFYGWESNKKRRFLGIPYGYGAMVGPATGYSSPIVGATYLRVGDRDARISARIMVLPHPTKGIFGLGFSYKL